MEFVTEYAAFFLKTITVLIAVLIAAGFIASLKNRHKSHSDGELVIKKLNDDIEDYKQDLEIALYSEEELKALDKQRKKEDKEKAKKEKAAIKASLKAKEEPADDNEADDVKKRVFVLDFDGDVQASNTDFLRQEITAILTMATEKDEVVLRLESPGGVVHGYGFAASQLQRIRSKNIPLTVCVDHVAASGGYMMAVLANKIIAAPFAVVGSIGVVAQLPNFSKVLKKYDVDYELYTAGEYKRTVTMFGENTSKAKEKFQEDLEETHVLFKNHVHQFRPSLNIEEVANGDIWYGTQAIENGLIDAVGTSDDYIIEACKDADVYSVQYELKKTLKEKLGLAIQSGVESGFIKLFTFMQQQYHRKG